MSNVSTWIGIATGMVLTGIGLYLRDVAVLFLFAVAGAIFLFLVFRQKAWTRKQRQRKRNQALAVGGATALLMLVPFVFPKEATIPVLDGAKLLPGLYYPHEWDNYQGIKEHDQVAVIDPNVPPKQRYNRNEIRVQITTLNQNEGLPLEEGTINLRFVEDGLKVRRIGSWQESEPNKAYHFLFARPITNAIAGFLDGPLMVVFPKPGLYHILVTMDGKWVKNPPRDKVLTFELYE